MKKVSDSKVVMHELILPNDTNILGNVLGGRVMHFIDICAAMSAYKHARSAVVTASIDHLNFLAPAKKGDILILKSSVNYVSNTSMEIGVRVESENTMTGSINHTASAHLTFVALDSNGKPKKVDKIVPETEIEKERFHSAEKRVKNRRMELLGK
tara:strand:- start:749 stop:1213 length:465 start_codon:yes stop_codon:yes gene_type:complete